MSAKASSKRQETASTDALSGLSTTMMRHARRMQRVLGGDESDLRNFLPIVSTAGGAQVFAEIRPSEICQVSAYLKALRRRDILFSPGLFGDPAWDMLLDLFVAQGEGRRVSMESVCLASGVAASTAWRKFGLLEDAELVTRHPDPDDRRRTHVELTPLAVERVRLWLERLGPKGQ